MSEHSEPREPAPAPEEVPAAATADILARMEAGNDILRRVLPALSALHPLPQSKDYARAPFILAPSPGARNLLITFGGNTGYLLLAPAILDRADCHVLALRDPRRCFAVAGIPGLGATYAQCLESIRLLAAALDAESIFCCGASAGGYPALRYGLDLRACGVLAFSPPTTLDLRDDYDAPLSRYPQLTALYKAAPEMAIDLAKPYERAEQHPSAILFYSSSNARDVWLATRMSHIRGIEIRAVADEAGHRVFQWLNETNTIPYHLDHLLKLRPAGRLLAAAE